MANKPLQFEGDIRMWKKNTTTGALTPVNPDPTDPQGNTPVEASAQSFTYEAGETRAITSKRRERYGQTIYSENDPGVSGLSLQLVAIPPAVFGRMFYGAESSIAVTGAAVTNSPVVMTQLGIPYNLPHRNLAASPAPVVTNTAGDTTYVAGTDYVIDRRNGTVMAVAGGAITAAQTVHVDYTHASYTGTQIDGGSKPSETFYITGDYKNRPDGKSVYLTIWQVSLSNDGDVDLLSSDPISPTLTGTMITPEGKNSPYVVEVME